MRGTQSQSAYTWVARPNKESGTTESMFCMSKRRDNAWQCVAMSKNEWQCVAISGNQWQSVAIS